MKKGLIHVYCGDGKGKTTAAMGLILRSLGRGRRVVLMQFLKGWETGEILMLEKLDGITIFRGKEGTKFTCDMTPEEREHTRQAQDETLRQAMDAAKDADLLVLDEVIGAYNFDMVDQELVRSIVENKPEGLELVLTGRDPDAFFLEKADYMTEMRAYKHPYTKGIQAREGIEF